MTKQRGFTWWIWLAVIAFAAAAGYAVVHKYNKAIERAEKAELEVESITAKYTAFVAQTEEAGKKAKEKATRELQRQRGAYEDRIKELTGRVSDSDARFARLSDASRGGAGSGGVPAVPEAARPADDAARDQRLLEVLRHAQDATDRLIELQAFIRGVP